MSDIQLDLILCKENDTTQSMRFVVTNMTNCSFSNFALHFMFTGKFLPMGPADGAESVETGMAVRDYRAPEGLVLLPGGQWEFSQPLEPETTVKAGDTPILASLKLEGPGRGLMVSPVQAEDCNPRHVSDEPFDSLLHELPDLSKVTAYADKKMPHIRISAAKSIELNEVANVNALTKRIFTRRPLPFVFASAADCPVLHFEVDTSLRIEEHYIEFSGSSITLRYSDSTALRHGLIALARLVADALNVSSRIGSMPSEGYIRQQPRFEWRGAYQDMTQFFYPVTDTLNYIDCLAWKNLNRFHWRLDDHGNRELLPIYPEMIDLKCSSWTIFRPTVPILKHPLGMTLAHYSAEQIISLFEHAERVGVEIVPSLDEVLREHENALIDLAKREIEFHRDDDRITFSVI